MQNSLSLNFPTKYSHVEINHLTQLFFTKVCTYFKTLYLAVVLSVFGAVGATVILPYSIIHNWLLYFILIPIKYIGDLRQINPDHSSDIFPAKSSEKCYSFAFKCNSCTTQLAGKVVFWFLSSHLGQETVTSVAI